MTDTLAIRIPASHENLQLAEEKIDELARLRKWSEQLLFKVKLAIEEVCLNSINHGYGGDESGKIEIRLRCAEDALTIEIIDDAAPFDPLTEAAAPDTSASIEERPVGGLGVHLVKKMMDEVSYTREGDRNRLVLKLRLAP